MSAPSPQKDINEVLLQGIILNKYVTPDVTILTINTGSATPVRNYPKVVFFGEPKAMVDDGYETGDHVTIKGNIQSSKKNPEIKNQIMQTVFGESIKMTPTIMEEAFGLDIPTSYKRYVDTFKISGLLQAIELIDCPAHNMVKLTIRTVKNGHVSFGEFVYYSDNAVNVANAMKPDERIYAIGCVQTSRTTSATGETEYHQDYVLTEIAKTVQ